MLNIGFQCSQIATNNPLIKKNLKIGWGDTPLLYPPPSVFRTSGVAAQHFQQKTNPF